ncbi:uncharacterized protein LOC141724048 [Apium graveolens]|uniref:uncharacterized protein LOC141724048 n=1 Tax=Apium graveolens TaxID=4045 RepID=UPI003D78C0C5
MVSLRYPGEKDNIKWLRVLILWLLTAFYIASYMLKVSVDYSDDRASFMHYTAPTTSGDRVFYPKFFLHLVGILVLISTIVTSVYNCLPNSDPWGIYGMGITTGVLSLVYAVAQTFRSDKKNRLVQRVGDQRHEVGLKVCTDTPLGEELSSTRLNWKVKKRSLKVNKRLTRKVKKRSLKVKKRLTRKVKKRSLKVKKRLTRKVKKRSLKVKKRLTQKVKKRSLKVKKRLTRKVKTSQ